METEKKLRVLEKVAAIFNGHKISWAVGASLLLYLKGIAGDFNDIDILIDEKDAAQVQHLLSNHGALQKGSDEKFKSRVFLEYIIDGVELDIIAGFTIVSDNIEYYFPFNKDSVSEFAEVNGETIPLHSVEEWKKYYSLMGRAEKVRLIDKNTTLI